jgi:regulator of sigma E protease
VLTLLATLVLLSVLILVHELGHFVAAKSVDIEVQRFSLGMGPRVAGFRVGETEFVLSALPIGGYVSMAGMQDDEAAAALEGGGRERRLAAPRDGSAGPALAEREPERPLRPSLDDLQPKAVEQRGETSGALEEYGTERRLPSSRDFDAKPLWARVWVVSAGVLMNFLFAILVFALIAFAWGEPIDLTRQIDVLDGETLPAAAAPLTEVPIGAEVVAVNDRPVQNWNMLRRALIDAGSGPVTLRFADAEPVTFRMPTQDSLRAAVLMSIRPHYAPVLGEVIGGGAGAIAGLQRGDRILSAGGMPVHSWWDFEAAIRTHPEQPLPLVIERNGEQISLTATPGARSDVRRGETIGFLNVGVSRPVQVRTFGPGEALVRGAEDTWRFSVTIVSFLGNLITGRESPRQVGSVLTIGQISGEFARAGLEPFLYWMALFSVNLAVLNLLPIPILDGGHLMFMLIEGIRGRPLSVEQRIRLSHVGLIIVVGIMVWALTNDVLRVFGI